MVTSMKYPTIKWRAALALGLAALLSVVAAASYATLEVGESPLHFQSRVVRYNSHAVVSL